MPAMTLQVKGEEFKGLALFVCTHASRDCRCGTVGTALARRLRTLVEEQGLDLIQVYQVSHVGGHKVCITAARFHTYRVLMSRSLISMTVGWHLTSFPACPRPCCRFRHWGFTQLSKSWTLEESSTQVQRYSLADDSPACALQYAGNVLVYGSISTCDGDWYGGVDKGNAEAFLDALVGTEVSLPCTDALSL